MLSMYSGYRCKTCKLEFVLLTEDIQKMDKDRYIACPYCNSRNVSTTKVCDNLQELMRERSYKRNKHGALVQR